VSSLGHAGSVQNEARDSPGSREVRPPYCGRRRLRPWQEHLRSHPVNTFVVDMVGLRVDSSMVPRAKRRAQDAGRSGGG
jgi:hypothetical protein